MELKVQEVWGVGLEDQDQDAEIRTKEWVKLQVEEKMAAVQGVRAVVAIFGGLRGAREKCDG
jgi:hypothetical protein